MPIYKGEKWACESCVRGHRVSACLHTDRDLKRIPPKGRPVKQCEHCRTARKSKSHHGKCDCGSKKDKKEKEQAETKDTGCCCHQGENCSCSTRSDNVEVRMERSLKRPTHPVTSKPALSKSQSDDKLLHVVNGHHKPCHRNNNAAHEYAPYRIPRPRSLHAQSAESIDADIFNSFSDGSDLMLRRNTMFDAPPSISRTNSGESIDNNDNMPEEIFHYDIDSHFAQRQFAKTAPSLENVTEEPINNYSNSWPHLYSSELNMNNVMGLTIDTSPNFTKDTGLQLFSPSDLPLISPQVSNFNQTISHSSDSANDSIWAADNVFSHDHTAVQDTWNSPSNNSALASFLQGTTGPKDVSAMSSVMSTAQLRHLSSSSAITAINFADSETPATSNALVIPADPDSLEEEQAEDWWSEGFVSKVTGPSEHAQMTQQLHGNFGWLQSS